MTFTADAPPAFDGGRRYFLYKGVLEARDPRSQVVRWRFTGDGQLTAAPIVVNGFVYAASASGQVWALDGTTGEVAWTDNAGAPVLSPGEVDLSPDLVGLAAGQGVIAVPATNLLVAYGPEASRTPASRLPSVAPPPPGTTRLASRPPSCRRRHPPRKRGTSGSTPPIRAA